MVGSTPRMVWKQPFMLRVTMSSNSSGVVSTPVLPIGPEPPATLTKMSMRPYACLAAAAACSHCFGSVRSQGTTIAADQRQTRALLGERHGDGRAHAFGRTGDHRNLSFELQVHGGSRVSSSLE